MVEIHRESELIERLKQGERPAFDALVVLYREKGLAVAYNLVGNIEDAKDVLQEAFIKVYMNIKGFREQAKFSTWFYRIVTNCAVDFLRKNKRALAVSLESESFSEEGERRTLEVADTGNEPAKIAAEHEFNAVLQTHIAKLSRMQRLCFVLKHQNGFKVDEIARILQCRPSTVKVHLFRAVEALRKNVGRYLL